MSQALDFSIVIWGVIFLFSAMAMTIIIKEIYEHVMEKKGKKKKKEIRILKRNNNEEES